LVFLWFLPVLILTALYLLALRGRRKHPDLAALRGWYYAHRGLHAEGLPENSLGAFRAALEQGYGAELDVHLMADGNLAVIHDSSLLRTANASVAIEDLTAEQLKNYPLTGSQECIPTLEQVLALFAGAAPLIIELKPAKGNHAALTQRVCQVLSDFPGTYALESFDPRCLHWLKKHAPQMLRGQLSENFLCRNPKFLPRILQFAASFLWLNALSRPDFVAYRFSDRKHISCRLCRKLWGLQGVAWTITSKEDLEKACKEGWIPIFENIDF